MRDVAIEPEQFLAASNSSLFENSPDSRQSNRDFASNSNLSWLPKLDLNDQNFEETHKPKGIFTLVAEKPQAPEKHTMSSRVFSLGWTFDITGPDGKSEGVVDQRLLNLRKTFEYKDENGQLKSKGQERLLSWGTKIDIYDEKGNAIGGIQEHVFKSWWKPSTVYSIVDAQGKELAKSEKLEMFSTNFTLKNPQGEKIATIHRPWLNFIRDNWTIDILKPDQVDKRILYMIPAYKTSVDAERRARESNSNESSKSP